MGETDVELGNDLNTELVLPVIVWFKGTRAAPNIILQCSSSLHAVALLMYNEQFKSSFRKHFVCIGR